MSIEKTPTPELDKMKMIQSKYKVIGMFLEYLLGEKGHTICRYALKQDEKTKNGDETGYKKDDLIPIFKSIEQMLAEYFGINLKKVEQERRRICRKMK